MYKNWAKKGGASCLPALNSGTAPYPCMSTGDICRLPVGERAASDCVLFLWVVYPMLPDGLAVLKAWGFQFKSAAFTWVKLNPSGRGFAYGLGHWTRTSPEICLLGVRGNPRRVSRSVPNLIVSPRREHSRKPDEVRERIIALCGELPRIELFAREKADGWNAWGNEVASDIDLLSYGNVG
jgi:site-specific DNA-methyltransferase (adenine-specific)